jgi:hypothetical protein
MVSPRGGKGSRQRTISKWGHSLAACSV